MIAISWFLLVAFWFIAVLGAVVLDKGPMAIAIVFAAVVSMVGWYRFLSWFVGLRRLVRSHLSTPPETATFLDKSLTKTLAADVRLALESIGSQQNGRSKSRVGVAVVWGGILEQLRDGNRNLASLKWTTLELENLRHVQVPTNAVYFLTIGDEPCVVSVSGCTRDQNEFEDDTNVDLTPKLEVLSRSLSHASTVVVELLALGSRHSMYRGKMLSIDSQSIRIYERPTISEDRIVLPNELLALLKRSVVSRMEHHQVLLDAGHESKTGILLHGAPGTGKTLVSKLLVSLCPNHTAIVPVSMNTETIRHAFQLAAYLQPAMVVIDDVDLLAERRETNSNLTGLQELMNELDGMLPSTQAIVLMTTNRPDVLEPALASRPGRISQAIYFPLPEADMREKLLGLFTRKLDASQVDMPRWIQRTQGASPAFIEELVKKSIVFASMRSPQKSSPVSISDNDLDAAIHELVVLGGTLTSNILGFPAG
jgi:hypothetical protein